MIFTPSYREMREGKYLLPKVVKATASSCLCEEIFAELWQSFSFGKSVVEVTPADGFVFKVGEAECPDLMDFDFAISVPVPPLPPLSFAEFILQTEFIPARAGRKSR